MLLRIYHIGKNTQGHEVSSNAAIGGNAAQTPFLPVPL
jgi:hypothetical protein